MAKADSARNLDGIRHSFAHLLAAAVLEKYPRTKLGIGPVIEHGFYYDFEFKKGKEPGADVLPELERTMRRLVQENLPFTGEEVTAAQAKKRFEDQPFKLELIDEYAKEDRTLTIYTILRPGSGQTDDEVVFEDLCRGGHVKNTSEINPEAFTLSHLAGAYWRGSEKNPQLLRIYGLAFETKQELDDHLKLLEEAKKRDHKMLGPALDLFTFSELVGSGLPLWTPKGTLLRGILDDYVLELRKKRGYVRVEIPHITKRELYEKSGHWDKFEDELFRITTREGHEFAMKPMNCPHHTQIYARRPWSYRELPQRYANTTMVYRDEQSGELGGLTRVRSITQDDAHVFCRTSQTKEEFLKIWDIVHEFYGAFDIPLRVSLSFHDPKHPESYLGDKKTWQAAEAMLREIADEKSAETFEDIGEAAFYGPKLDFLGRDAIGREHQVATIQLDMNMPERFDLTCVNEKGEKERIMMIHAAIMGSIERFLSILIEHTAGNFPVWLAPTQAVILPVSEKFSPYAEEVRAKLAEAGVRIEIPDASETLGKRIRAAEKDHVPYILVVGEKEVDVKGVAVRERGKGDTGQLTLDAFIERITKEIAGKQVVGK